MTRRRWRRSTYFHSSSSSSSSSSASSSSSSSSRSSSSSSSKSSSSFSGDNSRGETPVTFRLAPHSSQVNGSPSSRSSSSTSMAASHFGQLIICFASSTCAKLTAPSGQAGIRSAEPDFSLYLPRRKRQERYTRVITVVQFRR